MASVTVAGTTWDTNAGNHTVVATPAVGDAIIVIAATSGIAGGTTAVSDNQAVASTYTQIDVDYTGFSTTGVLTAWVRNSLITAASSTTWTASQASSSGGGLCVLRISGMSIVGLGSIRGCGGQSSIASAATPAPVLLRRQGTTFSGTQAALTGNVVIGAVCCGTNSSTNFTPRSSPLYSEATDLGYNVPATGLEVMYINSGETASTITWGSAAPSTSAAIAFELDTSVPNYDYVVANRTGDTDRMVVRWASVIRGNFW